MSTNQMLTIFDYKHNEMHNEIRTTLQNGEIYFVAKDVCEVLEIVDHKTAMNRLDEDEKGVHTMGTPGGNQSMLCVNESGLYHLIFTSRKEEAKAFRRWVTQEVLPSIRKTGVYNPSGDLSIQVQELAQRVQQLEQQNFQQPALIPARQKDHSQRYRYQRKPITTDEADKRILNAIILLNQRHGRNPTAREVYRKIWSVVSLDEIKIRLPELVASGKIEKIEEPRRKSYNVPCHETQR